MTEPTLVPVAVACQCPGTPHDGDTVYLRPHLSLHGGIVAQNVITSDLDRGELQAGLLDAYIRYGVADWTFVDEDGEKVVDAIESIILADFRIGAAVADRADELYTVTVLNPLAERASKSSRRSQTNGSTSAPKASSSKRRKPPVPSSTTTTPTDSTATTSG
jgi:hypothetical protein